ncbi:hypothetical protein TRVA0_039S01156 [Trichomonascus vanleenenianus]|uniref:uncharacterized protein n=1 Tax=Trichomonascus vanleenenianus TaxID=2268995 RepID=UPI003EC9C32D
MSPETEATRQKRSKYVNCACYECKRRKIKCNGQTPCQRCGHLKLSCVYPENGSKRRRRAVATHKGSEDQKPEPRLSREHAEHAADSPFEGIPYLQGKRLIEVYDSELNSMYPLFREGELLQMYHNVWRQHGTNPNERDSKSFMYVATRLAVAIGSCISETFIVEGIKLYESSLKTLLPRYFCGEADLNLVVAMIMIHEFNFHSDRGIVGYRILGYASNVAMELGLHSAKEVDSKYSSRVERERARQVFWCVYCLDRRVSFYVKRPCVINDDVVDQKMPRYFEMVEPTENDLYRAMHLNYMIYYSQIAGKVKKISDISELKKYEEMMCKFIKSLPPELNVRDPLSGQSTPYDSRKLKSVLFLKNNLMFMRIYGEANQTCTLEVVNFARECVQELGRLYFETDLYTSCQIQYNHFLVSALDALYTASRQDPAEFGPLCAEELKLAFRLITLVLNRSKGDHKGNIWQMVSSFAVKLGLIDFSYGKLIEPSPDTSQGSLTTINGVEVPRSPSPVPPQLPSPILMPRWNSDLLLDGLGIPEMPRVVSLDLPDQSHAQQEQTELTTTPMAAITAAATNTNHSIESNFETLHHKQLTELFDSLYRSDLEFVSNATRPATTHHPTVPSTTTACSTDASTATSSIDLRHNSSSPNAAAVGLLDNASPATSTSSPSVHELSASPQTYDGAMKSIAELFNS